MILSSGELAACIAGGLVALVGVCLLAARRRVLPWLSDADLRRAGVEPAIRVVRRLPNSGREQVRAAFFGSRDFRWVAVGGDGLQASIDEEGSDDSRKVKETVDFMIEAMHRFSDRYCHTLVCSSTDGKFLGSMTLAPVKSVGGVRQGIQFVLALLPMLCSRRPANMKVKAVQQRMDAFGVTEEKHKEIMKGQEHMYVVQVGVAPAAQRQGVGRRLLAAAVQLANGKPLFLECHDGNVPFYEAHGYVRHPYVVTPSDKALTSIPYNGMVRPGSGPESAGYGTAGAAV